MVFQLTKEQLQYLNNDNSDVYPNMNMKVIHEDNRDILIINVSSLYDGVVSMTGFLEITRLYENMGWNLYAVVQPYIYFYKKKTLFNKFKNFFKKKEDKC